MKPIKHFGTGSASSSGSRSHSCSYAFLNVVPVSRSYFPFFQSHPHSHNYFIFNSHPTYTPSRSSLLIHPLPSTHLRPTIHALVPVSILVHSSSSSAHTSFLNSSSSSPFLLHASSASPSPSFHDNDQRKNDFSSYDDTLHQDDLLNSVKPTLEPSRMKSAFDDDSESDEDRFVLEEFFDDDVDDEGFVLEDNVDSSSRNKKKNSDDMTGLSKILFNQEKLLAKSPNPSDVLLCATLVAIVYGLVQTCASVVHGSYAALTIETSLHVLPYYAGLSVFRLAVGYTISLLFSLGYAYVAYRVPFMAMIMMLVIDILQSIPLLSFMPGVVLGLIGLFPGARVGVELASIFLLFTSMAWNLVLGFYQSLTGIPHDLQEAAEIFRASRWRRFWMLELPTGAMGLIWNSIISVAGGWFFLISIESFELGNQDFRLPGLGSFLAAAADASNYTAISAALTTVILVIIITDFFIWRPLIAWSQKFSYGSIRDTSTKSAVLSFLRRSTLVRSIRSKYLNDAWNKFLALNSTPKPFHNKQHQLQPQASSSILSSQQKKPQVSVPTSSPSSRSFRRDSQTSKHAPTFSSQFIKVLANFLQITTCVVFLGFVLFGVYKSIGMLTVLKLASWKNLGISAIITFLRVIASIILSLLWTVPVGVMVGRDPVLAAKIQPIVQIAASVPATALFPFLLLALQSLPGGGIQVGSIALMMLGTMWYILFNVIAGTQAIPHELFEVDQVYGGSSQWKRWKTLILPGIFPYLITGVVSAVGGAWNASIVSEYIEFKGGVLKTRGLGALISEAAVKGDYTMLLAGTIVMTVLVLLTNRFVWGPLYKLAEEKYRIM